MTADPRAPGGRPAVFLDRDGTINIEKDYLWRIEDFEFIPGAPEAIRSLNEAGFAVVVVSNQSGVARGYFGIPEVERLHAHMIRELQRQGARIDGVYFCPHHPEQGAGAFRVDCQCRKGRPGMLLQAAHELGLDLAASYMVGDKWADVEAGRSAGCRSLLVRTGHGEAQLRSRAPGDVPVFDSLPEAVDHILGD